MNRRLPALCLLLLSTLPLSTATLSREALAADEPEAHLSRFGHGAGPAEIERGFRLLDAEGTAGQLNAVAFDRAKEGTTQEVTLSCFMRVLEGGDGGSFLFLNTKEYGVSGPAPFLASAVEPNLKGTFAVGIDVHNPPDKEMFSSWGNYRDEPQREVSLHWDGREIVKRVAPKEFRGDFARVEIKVFYAIGGASVTVRIADQPVLYNEFIVGMIPYESRLAVCAGTRADATTQFDVKDIVFDPSGSPPARRAPSTFQVFNHVLTDNSKTSFDREIALPPAEWEYARVTMTIDIHDAGEDWDEWDRNGEVSVYDKDGNKWGIVPFITSYRTPCHWEVDVTHFRPLLAGKTRLEIAAGTTFYKNRGYMMSLSLQFHPGRPTYEPFAIHPIWVGTAKYGSAENHFQDFFEPRTLVMDEGTVGGVIHITTTGHSQIGEFTPSSRRVEVVSDTVGEPDVTRMFTNRLWNDDCYLNPNRPQFGTWKFSRAGWAPGDVVRPWKLDLIGQLAPGKTALFRYVTEAYDFSEHPEDQRPKDKEINQANQVVRAYLTLYREPGALMEPPAVLVTNVAGDSNAATAGIKRGDYLQSYDGKLLSSVQDLRDALKAAEEAGTETIPVIVYRGAERMEFELKPGKMGVGLSDQ